MSALIRLEGGLMSIAAPGADITPKWNQIFLPGAFHRSDFPDGVIKMDEAFFARLVENWRREGSRPVPVDYFHRGETGDDLPLEEKVAAGWISDLQVRPDGVWALIGWTERARGYIAADELRYLSPTFTVDGLDRTTGQSQGPTLFGAALLNDPYLKELPRVAASAKPSTPQPVAQEQNNMDPQQQMAALYAALGFPPGTKHEEAVTKATGMAKKLASMPASAPDGLPDGDQVLTAPLSADVKQIPNPNLKDGTAADHLDPGGDNPARDPMIPLSRGDKALELANIAVSKLAAKVEKMEAEKLATDITRLSDRLVSERRITPAMRGDVAEYAKAVGLSKADGFYSKFPAQQIGELGITGSAEASNSAEATKAYWAEVDSTQTSHKLSFRDAVSRVNSTNPELAKSITTLNQKPTKSA